MVKKYFNFAAFIAGMFFCVFVLIFLITGMDEIWDGDRLWWYGISVASALGSLGIVCISYSLSSKKLFSKILTAALTILIISIFAATISFIGDIATTYTSMPR